MSEHTKGKLEVLDDRRISITLPSLTEGCGYSSHCVALTYGGDERVNSHANARRLVACWNALEGTPTEVIENGSSETAANFKLIGMVMAMEEQRDELLKALKKIRRVKFSNWSDGEMRDIARAALAKAEAGKVVDEG